MLMLIYSVYTRALPVRELYLAVCPKLLGLPYYNDDKHALSSFVSHVGIRPRHHFDGWRWDFAGMGCDGF
jgi:hypothetical protein